MRYCNQTCQHDHALGLFQLERFEEAKALMRKTMPVARRVLGDSNEDMLLMRRNYSLLLCKDGSTLDDLREGVTTLEEIERTARRVLGGAHPTTETIGLNLRETRAVLRARETLPMSA